MQPVHGQLKLWHASKHIFSMHCSALCAGLAAVAVALVAVAGKQLIKKTATNRLTTFVLVASAALALTCSQSWIFPAVIVGGGVITLVHNSFKKVDMAPEVCRSLICTWRRDSSCDGSHRLRWLVLYTIAFILHGSIQDAMYES